jgi:hypothetical protein
MTAECLLEEVPIMKSTIMTKTIATVTAEAGMPAEAGMTVAVETVAAETVAAETVAAETVAAETVAAGMETEVAVKVSRPWILKSEDELPAEVAGQATRLEAVVINEVEAVVINAALAVRRSAGRLRSVSSNRSLLFPIDSAYPFERC